MTQKLIRVLVVDDEETIRGLSVQMLGRIFVQRRVGLNLSLAEGVDSAFQLLREVDNFQLIITDLSLSGQGSIDGLDVVKYAKNKGHDFVWALMSGHLLKEGWREAEKLGVVAFLQKPFRLKALHDTVALALGWEE